MRRFACSSRCPARACRRRSISTEIDLTAGYSGEEIRATASQMQAVRRSTGRRRLFRRRRVGRSMGRQMLRSSARRLNGADPIGTDVFGAAYPYGGRVTVMEAYAERYFKPRGALLGVRAGRFRTPFGIYGRSDLRLHRIRPAAVDQIRRLLRRLEQLARGRGDADRGRASALRRRQHQPAARCRVRPSVGMARMGPFGCRAIAAR